ncbi:DNA polymerase III subunit delta [Bartonella sp. DGB1]|uniref:DNA polymerase III subunit delta n=1 Tax=Bartonella sp. DGB1 TaxID=3239807 RepID=UPI003526082A
MAQKKAYEVEDFLKAESLKSYPVILIYGPDRGMVFDRANKIISLNNVDTNNVFSLIKMEVAELEQNITKLIDEANTISLFGEQRIIWVKDATNSKKLLNNLEMILKDIPPNLLILIEAGDLKITHGLRSLIEKHPRSMALPCYPDDAKSLDNLIEQYLKKFNLTITKEAKYLLKEYLGGDRYASKNELEKLCLYCLEKAEITIEDIKIIISDVANLNHDPILEAIFAGNISLADNYFTRYLRLGGNIHWLLSAISKQLQQLQMIHLHVQEDKLTIEQAVSRLKPAVFYKKKKQLELAAIDWSLPMIVKAIKHMQKLIFDIRQMPHLQNILVFRVMLTLVKMATYDKDSIKN